MVGATVYDMFGGDKWNFLGVGKNSYFFPSIFFPCEFFQFFFFSIFHPFPCSHSQTSTPLSFFAFNERTQALLKGGKKKKSKEKLLLDGEKIIIFRALPLFVESSIVRTSL